MLGKLGARQEKGQFFIDSNTKEFMGIVEDLKNQNARLITVSGLDDGVLKVIYHFELEKKIIHVFVPLNIRTPKINSITDIYPNAAFYERELAEMFNIRVKGHPDLRPLFLSKDMDGKAPLRKSYKVEKG